MEIQAEDSNRIEEEKEMDYDIHDDIGDFNDMDGDMDEFAALKKK